MKITNTKLMTVAIAASTLALSACAGYAVAQVNQPHMQNAIAALQTAKAELEVAEQNKGGHRVAALQHVNQALREAREGIDYRDGYAPPPPR